VINTVELLKKKLDLLEALQDIEIATSMLKSDGSSDNAIDESYKKLKTEMQPIDQCVHTLHPSHLTHSAILISESNEFKVIKKYCEEGHDVRYFSNFALEVLDVFKVSLVRLSLFSHTQYPSFPPLPRIIGMSRRIGRPLQAMGPR